MRADGSRLGWPVPEAVIMVVWAPDDGCQHPETYRAVYRYVMNIKKLLSQNQSAFVGFLK